MSVKIWDEIVNVRGCTFRVLYEKYAGCKETKDSPKEEAILEINQIYVDDQDVIEVLRDEVIEEIKQEILKKEEAYIYAAMEQKATDQMESKVYAELNEGENL